MTDSNIEKEERPQTNNRTSHLKELEEEQTQLKATKRKDTIMIRAEVNQTEGTNQIENRKTGETRNWFFENINKTNKPLVKLTGKKDSNFKNQK